MTTKCLYQAGIRGGDAPFSLVKADGLHRLLPFMHPINSGSNKKPGKFTRFFI